MKYNQLFATFFLIDANMTSDHILTEALKKIGCDKYCRKFEEAEVDYAAFLDITEENLREMEIPIGSRIKILKEAGRLKKDAENSGTFN